jgi:GDP-4-dehydro-6-deoxy-D-mannose reductase
LRPATILVTGAGGFAGSHLLDLLAGEDVAIVAWHRPGGAPRAAGPSVRWEAVDLLDRGAVREAIARTRPSAVYHCAAAAHVGKAWDSTESTFAVNVRGTDHLCDALRREDLRVQFLIPSSAMIYRPSSDAMTEDDPLVPPNPYGLSKLAQELLALRSIPDGIDVRVARAFNHIGPRQDPFFAAPGFARRIADIERGRWAPEISVGNLDAQRDLTDVRDTVRAYRLILERGVPGRPYNVCSGRAVTIRHLLDLLIARARSPVTVKIDPARYRPNDNPILLGDPSRLRDELGWTPEIPLERTVDDLLEYWRGKTS